MRQSLNDDSRFVVDLLTTLQKDHFSLAAWWHFLKRSWNMACETAQNAPALTRSWLYMTTFMAVLVVSLCIAVSIFEGSFIMLRVLPGFLFCVVWQQSDTFWHLGLNRHMGKLLPSLGLANTLTGLRGLSASFLLGRLLGGVSTPIWLALTVFLIGVVTDILDGQVARWTHTQSRLGQIIDGETDFCLSLALSIILMQNGILPVWLGVVLILRFFVPLSAALMSYFLFARPVRFGSTIWGKLAGFTQCLYFFALLAPPPLQFVTHIANFPLLVATLFLTIAAPLAQIIANVQVR